ncbi:MAG TPA: molybdopterin-dependent oxidoreductase [Bacteroidia bacterium]|nr:molybdopterin-dependent oxidoreductase [Bacteroidia bacterium]HRS58259.1 molybdopterin-dependent oxidoreductase [Bacteroidia bacterium]
MKTSRREFIKISSAGAAGLAITGSALKLFAGKDKELEKLLKSGEVKRYPTYCEICFWKCAGWTYVNKEGKIWKVVGNEEDPHCNGRLCPRGTGGIGSYYDEDRLKKPLIRVSKNGKQEFREATWDEAFEVIASKMKKIAAEHGPECIALFNHGTGGKYFTTLMKAFGSGNITAPSFAQCRGPREVGFNYTFGETVESPERTDIINARCMVLIGSHLGENMHNSQVQEMSDAIDRGITLITVDPRYSTVASKSKFWLPIKPATDLALLLAWIHVLIYDELYDKEYIARYATGFEELKEHVKDMTPEWAYGITTIKPDIIRKTAYEMANAKPSVIVHPGRHVTWYGDDTQRSRAIAILNALLGSWGRKGGFYHPSKVSVPDFPHPEFPQPKRTWRDVYPDKYLLADEVVSTGICDASIPGLGSACNFKGWIVYATNLLAALPDQRKTIEAINNLDLLVVIDTMPAELAGYADVVLPECTYLERYDILRNSPMKEAYIALRMPAAEPMYDSKPGWWIAKQLAEKLGLGEYFPYKDMEEMLDWQLKQLGSSLEEMKKIGVKKLPQFNSKLYFEENEDVEFNTPSGKIELYSQVFADHGFDPIPVYQPHPEPPEGYYRLNYGRAPMHTFSRTANNPNLTDLMDENTLWVNPRVASEWGIENGQYIWIKNQDGVVSSFPIKVRITERIRWDSVFMVHGFGQTNKYYTRSYGRGASDTQMITNIMEDKIMGGTGMRGNFVTFLTEKPGKEVVS